MLPNNFQNLLEELSDASFYPKNLMNGVKEYREKISQIPRKITSYIEQHDLTVPILGCFATGVALFFGGGAHALIYYPGNKIGAYVAVAGAVTAELSVAVGVLYNDFLKKRQRNKSD